MGTATEFIVVVATSTPTISPDGTMGISSVPAVCLNMSPQSAKELMALLQDTIETFEREHGEIVTPFLQEHRG